MVRTETGSSSWKRRGTTVSSRRSMTSVIGLLFTPHEIAMASLFIAVLHVSHVMPLQRIREAHTDSLLDRRCVPMRGGRWAVQASFRKGSVPASLPPPPPPMQGPCRLV